MIEALHCNYMKATVPHEAFLSEQKLAYGSCDFFFVGWVAEPWQVLRLCPAQARRWFPSHEFMVVFFEKLFVGKGIDAFEKVVY